MVEKVARRFAVTCWGEDYDRLPENAGEQGLPDRQGARFFVRTIVEAMREPTKEMVEAVPYDMYEPDFAENWRTMIDVALAEKP
jgi:hypothetical protein